VSGPSFRRYDPRDAAAVVRLHEWAMREAGTDPGDIPGSGDVRDVQASYLDAGGEFLVGTVEADADTEGLAAVPGTFDGRVVAVGGFLPNEAGHADERTVPGAAELHRMRVAPPCQGRGYGRALLDALERRAETAGYERLLATTARRQQRAVALYERAGYAVADESAHGDYDLVHFEKEL